MTLEEIRQRYPNEWVIIEFTELDQMLRVVEGEVIAHSPDKEEINRILLPLRNEKLSIEFTGDGGTGKT